jgi:hypothetical protein
MNQSSTLDDILVAYSMKELFGVNIRSSEYRKLRTSRLRKLGPSELRNMGASEFRNFRTSEVRKIGTSEARNIRTWEVPMLRMSEAPRIIEESRKMPSCRNRNVGARCTVKTKKATQAVAFRLRAWRARSVIN